jgi:hypothetical protein
MNAGRRHRRVRPRLVIQERLDYLAARFFASDSRGNRKGVIEVIL